MVPEVLLERCLYQVPARDGEFPWIAEISIPRSTGNSGASGHN